MPPIASMKQSCFYDDENDRYKTLAISLCLACGLLNFLGEFCVVFAFQHALMALLNQGILTSVYALGSVIVLAGSVIFLKEHVKACEYAGTIFVIVGTVVISLSKKQAVVSVSENLGLSIQIATETAGPAILFAIGATACFGFRSLLLKYMAIKEGIDGVSASAFFLMVDGSLGGAIGVILAICGGGYANFRPAWIVQGICSGLLAGTGVLCINIAVSTGVAGPAFAIANLCSVIQAFGDWGFLGQVPVPVEWVGLAISVIGGIIMSVGDQYIIQPLF